MDEILPQDRYVRALRALYASYGYRPYRMGKFEEYDLYARNRDFLMSEQIITFTDTNGRLMALKPDVTLSIVKNSPAFTGGVRKLFYREQVYRVTGESQGFRELTQVGLECLGSVGDYEISEVLQLAAESLLALPVRGALEFSHLGLLRGLLSGFGLEGEAQAEAIRAIGGKNPHELRAAAESAGLSASELRRLSALVRMAGEPGEVLPVLAEALKGTPEAETAAHLLRVSEALRGTPAEPLLRFDFSAVGDLNYYNGIVFRGYAEGIPEPVLSGGRYDLLMRKFRREGGAVGFAVFPDRLERVFAEAPVPDAELLLTYAPGCSPAEVAAAVRSLRADGTRVLALPEGAELPECPRRAVLSEGGHLTVC